MTAGAGRPNIRFTRADQELFSRASGDINPLHLSDDYAHQTAYGQPVVYGVLAGLAAFERLKHDTSRRAESITLDFSGALFTEVDYTVHVVEDTASRAMVEIRDGLRLMFGAVIQFRPGSSPTDVGTADGVWPTDQPTSNDPQLATEDAPIEGRYQPAGGALQELQQCFDLTRASLGARELGVLLWSSYLAGMQLPGERALLGRIAVTFTAADATWPVSYRAFTRIYDERFEMLRIGGAVTSSEQIVAEVEIRSFVRRPATTLDLNALQRELPASVSLEGKVALVTGASRGLGAALTATLVQQGGTVYANYQRSDARAEALQQSLNDAPGRLILARGDAGDSAYCRRLSDAIEREHGGLDFLIANACPPLDALSIDPESMPRILAYIEASLACVANPLAAFLPSLAHRAGWAVVMSSTAVTEPPAMWPHYVAAKRAIEGLAATAAAGHRSLNVLIPRPPRLATDLTNVPMGHRGALAPEMVATAIARRLLAAGPAEGEVEFLLDFPAQPADDARIGVTEERNL